MERTILSPDNEPRREPARRLFFALWPDEILRAAFALATHKAAQGCGGRPVPAHNLHATLLFLGFVAESRVAEVRAMGARAAVEVRAIRARGASELSHRSLDSAYLAGEGAHGALGPADLAREPAHRPLDPADLARDPAHRPLDPAHPAGDFSSPRLIFDRVEFWKKPRVLVATTSVAAGAGHSLASALVGVLQRETLSAGFAPDLKPFRAHVTVARKVASASQTLQMHAVPWPVTELTLVESVTLAAGPRYDALDSWPLGAGT